MVALGDVYIFGNKWFCKSDSPENKEQVSLLQHFDEPIQAIGVGGGTAYVSTMEKDSHVLYSRGTNDYGSLGTGDTTASHYAFVKTSFAEPVSKIATGYGLAMLLSKGRLFVTGRNTQGQV